MKHFLLRSLIEKLHLFYFNIMSESLNYYNLKDKLFHFIGLASGLFFFSNNSRHYKTFYD